MNGAKLDFFQKSDAIFVLWWTSPLGDKEPPQLFISDTNLNEMSCISNPKCIKQIFLSHGIIAIKSGKYSSVNEIKDNHKR
jgi:hypothetical protein